ncbi:MAG: hypothetical protein GYB64_06235 [Chloroflexi bacterium]|nr:hypothetical protein [Chloroflexota bacterium]
MIKLLMTWDIRDGRDAEYFEFVVREWVPGITRLGLQPTEAWFTIYGDQPQVLTGAVAKDVKTLDRILESSEWSTLQARLDEYVENYDQKIVRNNGNLQIF